MEQVKGVGEGDEARTVDSAVTMKRFMRKEYGSSSPQ
jgi:hypothetical protein